MQQGNIVMSIENNNYVNSFETLASSLLLFHLSGPLKAMCEISDRTGPPELEGPQIVLSKFIADSSLEQQQLMSAGTRGK